MEIWKAVVVGLVQGLTEFLPVSSSAHIVLSEQLLGIETGALDLAIVVHLGTLVAVFAALWYRLEPVTTGTLRGIGELARGRSPWADNDFRWGVYIVVATIPAALVGLFLKDPIEKSFTSPAFAGGMLLVTGTILFGTRFLRHTERDVGWWSSIAVGFAQALAILPGISRSGTTIATGLYCRVERTKAAEFSFLLAVPIILGGSIVRFLEMTARPNPADMILPHGIAFIVSGISGFWAIKLLLRFVRQGHLSWFTYYCWAVGLFALVYF